MELYNAAFILLVVAPALADSDEACETLPSELHITKGYKPNFIAFNYSKIHLLSIILCFLDSDIFKYNFITELVNLKYIIMIWQLE